MEKRAVYANRRRIHGEYGKRMQRRRGEKIKRNFAHQFDTDGMDRPWVRGREKVHKKLLIRAAACNLALLMRSLYGAVKLLTTWRTKLFFSFLRLLRSQKLSRRYGSSMSSHSSDRKLPRASEHEVGRIGKNAGFRHALLATLMLAVGIPLQPTIRQ